MDNLEVRTIIDGIFEERLEIRDDNGFYVKLPRRSWKQIKECDTMTQCMYSCVSKGRKICIGSELESEDIFQLTMEFMYKCLYEIFTGQRNDSLDNLKCNGLADVLRILTDLEKQTSLSKYLIVNIEMMFRTHIRNNEVDTTPIEIKDKLLRDNYVEAETGVRTEAIMSKYINEEYLTKKQVQFMNSLLEYGTREDGAIYNLDDKLLYTKQLVYDYKKKINKKLEKYL